MHSIYLAGGAFLASAICVKKIRDSIVDKFDLRNIVEAWVIAPLLGVLFSLVLYKAKEDVCEYYGKKLCSDWVHGLFDENIIVVSLINYFDPAVADRRALEAELSEKEQASRLLNRLEQLISEKLQASQTKHLPDSTTNRDHLDSLLIPACVVFISCVWPLYVLLGRRKNEKKSFADISPSQPSHHEKSGRQAHKSAPECCICLDVAHEINGAECGGGFGAAGLGSHFVCASCLNPWVQDRIQADAWASFLASDGAIRCPVKKCGADPFAISDIAKLVSRKTFDLLLAAGKAVVEARAAAHHERLLRARDTVWANLDEGGFQRLSGQVKNRQFVEERVLTLLCPSGCGQAFDAMEDDDGCFALTCSRCATVFCAYCGEGCGAGADAHKHVAECPDNIAPGRAVNASMEVFEAAQRLRRIRALKDFLGGLEPSERASLLKEIEVNLNELGIKKSDLVLRSSAGEPP